MGKFDIDAQQINEAKLTLNELSKEIEDEDVLRIILKK